MPDALRDSLGLSTELREKHVEPLLSAYVWDNILPSQNIMNLFLIDQEIIRMELDLEEDW